MSEDDKNGITIKIGAEDGGDAVSVAACTIRDARIGKKLRGRVVSYKPYGFFVETDTGEFGLVHGRNVAGWKWGDRFDQVFRFGSEIDVTVVDIEAETDRMSFACEMPDTAGLDAPEADAAACGETITIPRARRDAADRWAAEHPEASAAALAWLRSELAGGPLYGPLTNELCERFGVPIPVSYWIRRFPDFVCYSGNGDNPSDLPAVSLVDRAGDVEYWKGIKLRFRDLSGAGEPAENSSRSHATLVGRLDKSGVFPGSRWIAEYMKMLAGLKIGKGVYGVSDTVERLAIPMLGQLGWDVSPSNAALVRGGESTFDITLFGGTASSGNISVAVKCAPAGTPFGSCRGVVEQVLGLYNRLGGDGGTDTKVLWTDGGEWVAFTGELLARRIGILADHRGDEVLAEAGDDGGGLFKRVVLPVDVPPSEWLAAFADLSDIAGR
ncbi:MAG: S1 RNA-binding domain-containing protein [Kiritimatiellae bacterium]|nr:S1 RNA-binding domain-containing protein [Kiritimatiellia bacterium]